MALQLQDRVEPFVPRVPAPPAALSGAAVGVSLRGVAKSFGDREVLRGLDLDVAPGEFVGVVGRSGCGKSTLLRLIAGLDAPSTGEVRVDGRALSGLNLDARVMFQDARLLPWKRVRDNVALGLGGLPKAEARERASDALARVGLGDRGGDWPGVLSGGQRQRVALARALATRPGLLLLDEPLGALDALTRMEMQKLVEQVWRERGFTALLVTHDVEEAVALCDRVLVIEEGAVTLDARVDLPRPRRRTDPAFARLADGILGRLLAGSELPR